MEQCPDTVRRRALKIYFNCSLAHYDQPLIPTTDKLDYKFMYTHLNECGNINCTIPCCKFMFPFLNHQSQCKDRFCPFCAVVLNFERERFIAAQNNEFVRNSNLGVEWSSQQKKCPLI